jgi:acyl carrier protein
MEIVPPLPMIPLRRPNTADPRTHCCGSFEIRRAMADRNAQTAQEAELAHLLVKTLNLEVLAEDIEPEAPLYGEGLGLDSIDMLEIALTVSQQYGVKLRADDEKNHQIFGSLRSLNTFIQASRTP